MSYGNNRGGGSGLTVPETDPAYDQTDPALLPAPVTPQPHYIYNTQYIIPDSDARRLTESELWAYSREALRYIRNEILARHGYAFGTSKFAEYFGSKAWYVPGGYENAVLTATEWDNIALIKKVERAMDALGTENAGYLDITTIRLNQQNNLCPGQ